jgi:hypothetical protein
MSHIPEEVLLAEREERRAQWYVTTKPRYGEGGSYQAFLGANEDRTVLPVHICVVSTTLQRGRILRDALLCCSESIRDRANVYWVPQGDGRPLRPW